LVFLILDVFEVKGGVGLLAKVEQGLADVDYVAAFKLLFYHLLHLLKTLFRLLQLVSQLTYLVLLHILETCVKERGSHHIVITRLVIIRLQADKDIIMKY